MTWSSASTRSPTWRRGPAGRGPRSGCARSCVAARWPRPGTTRHGLFGQERTLIQVAIGDVPHGEVLRAIELLGTKVAPLVQAGL